MTGSDSIASPVSKKYRTASRYNMPWAVSSHSSSALCFSRLASVRYWFWSLKDRTCILHNAFYTNILKILNLKKIKRKKKKISREIRSCTLGNCLKIKENSPLLVLQDIILWVEVRIVDTLWRRRWWQQTRDKFLVPFVIRRLNIILLSNN